MKKYLLITFIFIYSLTSNAQLDLDYGIKTGLNYNSNGSLSIYYSPTGGRLFDIVQSEQDFGFHVGTYAQLNFTKFYIRPELLFSKTKSTYNHGLLPASEFKLSMFEIPVLLGFKIKKPISLYVGPSFQYIIDNEFSTNFDIILENDFVLGLNIGVAMQLHKFGFDLRFSTGLSENLAIVADNTAVDGFAYFINAKSDQFIFSFSYQIN